MTDNTQELRELFVKHGYPKMTQAELELIPAITDWHNKKVENYKGIIKMSDTYKFEAGEVYYSEKAVNKKVEAVLDRLENKVFAIKQDIEVSQYPAKSVYEPEVVSAHHKVIPVSAIEAERNKLEESKQ